MKYIATKCSHTVCIYVYVHMTDVFCGLAVFCNWHCIYPVSQLNTRAYTHTTCDPRYTAELYKVNLHVHFMCLAASKIFICPCFLNHDVLEKVGGHQVEFHIKIWILKKSWQKYLPLISDELAIYINGYDDKKRWHLLSIIFPN